MSTVGASSNLARDQAVSDKIYQVRVKSIKFMQKSAIAVHFYDVTHQIKMLEDGSNLFSRQVEQWRSASLSQHAI